MTEKRQPAFFFFARPPCRAKAKLHGTRRARTFTARIGRAGASFPHDRASKNRCGFSRPRARQRLGSLRLAASATGEQWTLTGNLAARLAGRNVRGRATNARVTRPPRRAPPPPKAGMTMAWPAGGWPPVSHSRPPRPTNHAYGRQPHRTSESPPPGDRPASADGVALGNARARARARAAAASPACWNKFLRPWPVIRSFV